MIWDIAVRSCHPCMRSLSALHAISNMTAMICQPHSTDVRTQNKLMVCVQWTCDSLMTSMMAIYSMQVSYPPPTGTYSSLMMAAHMCKLQFIVISAKIANFAPAPDQTICKTVWLGWFGRLSWQRYCTISDFLRAVVTEAYQKLIHVHVLGTFEWKLKFCSISVIWCWPLPTGVKF